MGKRYGRNQKRRHKEYMERLINEYSHLKNIEYQQRDELVRARKFEGMRVTGWSDQHGDTIHVDLNPIPIACRHIIDRGEAGLSQFDYVPMLIHHFTSNFTEYLEGEIPKILDKLKCFERRNIHIQRIG